MTEKLDSTAIDRYSEACTDRLLMAAYSGKEQLTGGDLLSLSSIQQVNLFVLRELLEIWRAESLRLRSPFFDYESATVQESLRGLMNTLSNHIAVRKEALSPLVRKAVARSLFLILNPYDFYSTLIGDKDVSARTLRTELKYIRINSAPLERLAAEAEKRGASLTGQEALAVLDRILEEVSFSPEDIEPHLAQFSSVCPLDLASLYRVVRDRKPKESPVKPSKPAADVPTKAALPREERPTLADTFQKKRIQNIRDYLSINQKFMFTKVLFDGDFEAFNQTIITLDGCSNLNEAILYIEKNYSTWDRESEEYLEFSDILAKRFG